MGKKLKEMAEKISTGQGGFTLIEMLIVVAIVGIMAGIAVPGYMSWKPTYEKKAAARDVMSVFNRAKSEAVKRNSPVSIVFVAGTGVAATCTVFVDNGDNAGVITTANIGNKTQDAGEATLFVKSMSSNVVIGNINFQGAINTVTGYNSQGLPIANETGRLDITDTSGTGVQFRAVLGTTGMVNVLSSEDGGATWQ